MAKMSAIDVEGPTRRMGDLKERLEVLTARERGLRDELAAVGAEMDEVRKRMDEIQDAINRASERTRTFEKAEETLASICMQFEYSARDRVLRKGVISYDCGIALALKTAKEKVFDEAYVVEKPGDFLADSWRCQKLLKFFDDERFEQTLVDDKKFEQALDEGGNVAKLALSAERLAKIREDLDRGVISFVLFEEPLIKPLKDALEAFAAELKTADSATINAKAAEFEELVYKCRDKLNEETRTWGVWTMSELAELLRRAESREVKIIALLAVKSAICIAGFQ